MSPTISPLSEKIPLQWRYIDTKSNPADDASRGVTAESFVQNDSWIKGPAFLSTPESDWMAHPRNTEELSEDDLEVKCESSSFAVQVSEGYVSLVSIIERFSSWLRLLKFIALCLRCQRRFLKRKGEARQDSYGFLESPSANCSHFQSWRLQNKRSSSLTRKSLLLKK